TAPRRVEVLRLLEGPGGPEREELREGHRRDLHRREQGGAREVHVAHALHREHALPGRLRLRYPAPDALRYPLRGPGRTRDSVLLVQLGPHLPDRGREEVLDPDPRMAGREEAGRLRAEDARDDGRQRRGHRRPRVLQDPGAQGRAGHVVRVGRPRTSGPTLSFPASILSTLSGDRLEQCGSRLAPSEARGQRPLLFALEAAVDLLPDGGGPDRGFGGGGGRGVGMVREPPVDRLDVLARPEAASREVGARAERGRTVGVRGPHDKVGGPVEWVSDLHQGVGVPPEQTDVEGFLERAGASFAELVREVARVRSARRRRSRSVHGAVPAGRYLGIPDRRRTASLRTKVCYRTPG